MWFEHKAEKANQANGAGEKELERALQKALPDALMQAMQRMLANAFAPTVQGMAPKSGVLAPSWRKLPKTVAPSWVNPQKWPCFCHGKQPL